MHFRAAIITIKKIRLAVVLVDLESTYPAAGAALLQRAQLVFPTLPIILLSPRISGFSRSYATFELDHLVTSINADKIRWRTYAPLKQDAGELPF